MALPKKLALAFLLLAFPAAVYSADPCAGLSGQEKVSCYTEQVAKTQGQKQTLSAQIAQINKQIATTEYQISQTEQKLGRLETDIASVSGKIDRIENSLTNVSTVLANRIAKTYIAGRTDPIFYLLGAASFDDFWQKLEYLRQAQKHDKDLLLQMAQTRKNYRDQKDFLEDKKNQVETLQLQHRAQKAQLNRQNREKQTLLEVTRNDEARYQELLSEAQQELAALSASQFTGKKDVTKGEIVGLMGNSGFSTGPHLHFGVYNLSESQADSFNYGTGSVNPFDFLRNRSLNVGYGACNSDQNNFGNGSWDWPMSNPSISQCYGKTPFSWRYSNGLHEGVDMYDNGDKAVRAVEGGVAYFYRGNSNLGNNVRIFHNNGKMTLYLHLQ